MHTTKDLLCVGVRILQQFWSDQSLGESVWVFLSQSPQDLGNVSTVIDATVVPSLQPQTEVCQHFFHAVALPASQCLEDVLCEERTTSSSESAKPCTPNTWTLPSLLIPA